MAQGFLAVVGGKIKTLFGIASSSGAGDADKYIVTDSTGKLDPSFMPSGIGANQIVVPTSENLAVGDFVNIYDAAGVLTARKADNSNSREAWGYVEAAVTSPANATVKRLNTINASRSGLTAGAEYWLGTAGGVTNTALDANDVANAGKVIQYLGRAKSTTELATVEFVPVYL